MLPKANRLRKPLDFSDIRYEGKTLRSSNITIKAFKRNDKEPTRFAFRVYKTVDPRAVHRNRLLRAFRSAVRQMIFTFPKSLNIIVIAEPSVTKLTTDEIVVELTKLLTENFIEKNYKNPRYY